MKRFRFAGMVAALVLAVGAALVLLAPVVHGQSARVFHVDGPDIKAIDLLAGRRSQIGVSVRDVDDADVEREQLGAAAGAVVDEVRGESPAEAAGFKAGDVVVAFDGERVRSARQFARLVEETPAGRRVTATVTRGGRTLDLEVTPDSRPAFAFDMPRQGRGRDESRRNLLPGMRIDPFEFEFEGELPSITVGRARLGVGVQSLTRELAEHFGAAQGVLVNSVEPASPASRAGMKVGDVITEVDGTRIDDAGDLRRRLAGAGPGDVTVAIVRERKPLSLKVTLDEPDTMRSLRPRTRV